MPAPQQQVANRSATTIVLRKWAGDFGMTIGQGTQIQAVKYPRPDALAAERRHCHTLSALIGGSVERVNGTRIANREQVGDPTCLTCSCVA